MGSKVHNGLENAILNVVALVWKQLSQFSHVASNVQPPLN